MFKSVYRRLLVVMIVALLIGGAVAAQDSGAVIVQLNWIHDVAFGGFYMAIDEGYYAEYDLDVELRIVFDEEGNFIDVIDEVASGRAQFGIADFATLLYARADGFPVVAIATNFQRNPLAFVSLAENNILTPGDLVGKTVQVSEYNVFMLEALLASYDIDPSEVNIVDRLDYTTDPLTSGETDVQDAWVTNEIAILTVLGVEFNAIYPFEYGIDMYPDLIFTSEALLAENPELVQGFLAATFQGIQHSVDDPEHAAEVIVLQDEENIDLAIATESMFRAVPLLIPSGSQPGMIDPVAMEIGYEIMVDAEIIEEGIVDIEDAYTMEFLDAIYADMEE